MVQWPNIPLWLFFCCRLAALLLHGQPAAAISYIGSASLSVWAVLEIASGSSLFRRILGSAVLISIAVSVCRKVWG
jgi:hypothetical protein